MVLSTVARLDQDSRVPPALQTCMKISCAMLTVLIGVPCLDKGGEEMLSRIRGSVRCMPCRVNSSAHVGKYAFKGHKICPCKMISLQKGSGCGEWR